MTTDELHKVRRELANKQLDYFYRNIEADRGRRLATRNWFITIWTAVLIAVSSNRLGIQGIAKLFLLVTPVISFWLLETLSQIFVVLNSERAEKLEIRLMEDNFKEPLTRSDFLVAGWNEITYTQKIKAFLKNLFQLESVWVFYCTALACSIGFVVFL